MYGTQYIVVVFNLYSICFIPSQAVHVAHIN